jgi:hypothetical protein
MGEIKSHNLGIDIDDQLIINDFATGKIWATINRELGYEVTEAVLAVILEALQKRENQSEG